MTPIYLYAPDTALIRHARPVDLIHAMRTRTASQGIEWIPAEDSVLVRAVGIDLRTYLSEVADLINADDLSVAHPATDTDTDTEAEANPAIVTLDVVYDGADLDEVARSCAMGVDQVISMHSQQLYCVAFCGFAPGFGYLTGLPSQLHLPRRPEPRTAVPAGSVAIAAHYSAVYPRESPGGWHLLGTTQTRLFDEHTTPPALLQPGTRVRFHPIRPVIPVRTLARPSVSKERSPSALTARAPADIEIISAGASAIIVDRGRIGFGDIAVGRSGPWSPPDFDLAQRLVGNDARAAGLEIVGGGFQMSVTRAVTVAVTGARGGLSVARHGQSVPVDSYSPIHLGAGAHLVLDQPLSGLRRWLAVRGGVEVDPVLGSRSTDVLAGIGPPPLRAGDHFNIDTFMADPPAVDHVPAPPHDAEGHHVVAIRRGPDADLFGGPGWTRLTSTHYVVSSLSNRVGVRLTSPDTIATPAGGPPPSRPLAVGAVQIPTSGLPVVMGPDHPVTGGYPVLGVLAQPSLAAAWTPGDTVTFIDAD
ncbi:MAG: carboxyltransferase domain-containing protein [Candidatus Nanopelagicales bacterium]